ncbi:MAG: DUF2231 domain-containing protein [Caldilineaceae bacterium]|nr:DUF2231 domain-containing protein [Caldilineaceae bacterium]
MHIPIAFLLLASVAGLLHMYWSPRLELRILTWWPMLLGWIACAVAVATGLLAQSGLPPQAPFRSTLNWHIGSGLALLVVYAAPLYVRWRRRPQNSIRSAHAMPQPDLLDDAEARIWLTLDLLAGIGLLIATGWNGGRLVYEWAVNVLG